MSGDFEGVKILKDPKLVRYSLWNQLFENAELALGKTSARLPMI